MSAVQEKRYLGWMRFRLWREDRWIRQWKCIASSRAWSASTAWDRLRHYAEKHPDPNDDGELWVGEETLEPVPRGQDAP